MGKEASRSCARLLVAAMLHYEPVVRKVALKSAIGCVGENPSLAGAFILALQEFLANAPSYPVNADSRCIAELEHPTTSSHAMLTSAQTSPQSLKMLPATE